jgi:hypothetical protein
MSSSKTNAKIKVEQAWTLQVPKPGTKQRLMKSTNVSSKTNTKLKQKIHHYPNFQMIQTNPNPNHMIKMKPFSVNMIKISPKLL